MMPSDRSVARDLTTTERLETLLLSLWQSSESVLGT